jgi:spermidine synthase
VKVELIRDAERESGWWLLVDGSEQSYVDTVDPRHLEFEYVQMIAAVLDTVFDDPAPVTALHLGAGLCTVPRWLAATRPGSRQRVVEHSAEIAALPASLGTPAGMTVVLDDALAAVQGARRNSVDLLVCDVYEGPETVTSMFTRDAFQAMRRVLRPDGLLVVNMSDAAPFALARVVVATARAVFDSIVLLAEPSVQRGRRSGNLVIAAAADQTIDLAALVRRAAAGPVRPRVVATEDLQRFVGDATVAIAADQLPASGESAGRRFLG